MKRSIKIFSLFLLLANAVFAKNTADTESEKSKNYSKTYAVGSNDKILLSNTFGDLRISTWAKNEIKVDVTITVKARTDERAQKIMDRIAIEDGKNGTEIFFKTRVGDKNDDDGGGEQHNNENSSFKINYTVYLPSYATLDASNSFGELSIGDYDGTITLTSSFGMLTAGKLAKPKKVNLQFGKKTSVIEGMDGGTLRIGFSKAQVNKLSGDVIADLNQTGAILLKLDNGLKKLDLKNNFGNVFIDAPKNLNANFRIKTSFGNFSNQSSFAVGKSGDDDDDDERGAFNSRSYAGKAGSGTAPVTIKSNFGKITLGHDLSPDALTAGKATGKPPRS